jgi:hypothetical protein
MRDRDNPAERDQTPDRYKAGASPRVTVRADLLDANETIWAFVAAYGVGRVKNLLLRELAALASIGR